MHHGFGGGPPWAGGRRGGWFMQPPVWGFLQPCLLLVLAEGPNYGYSLIDELSKRKLINGDVDVGNLYRTLRKMEGEGLVESVMSDEGPGPNRRVYQITERGKQFLKYWAGTLEQRTRLINRFVDEFHRVFGEQSEVDLNFVSDDEENPI